MTLSINLRRAFALALVALFAAAVALPATAHAATMHGIDIFSGTAEDGILDRNLPGDFAIVKATEGTTYQNPYCKEEADWALRQDKLIGFYHFVNSEWSYMRGGQNGNAEDQARYFVDTVRSTGYLSRATLFLDWENNGDDDALGMGPGWAKAFLDEVYRRTGTTPGIYMSKAVTQDYDWSATAARYPLWGAQYKAIGDVDGYISNPWQSSTAWGAWGHNLLMHQYSSQTYLNGFGPLDANVFFGDKARWIGLFSQSDFGYMGGQAHRMYNPNTGEHFYTLQIGERNNLIDAGWTYEGVAWVAPKKNSRPVYRLYNPNGSEHHYTMSATERSYLMVIGWTYEGICWYSGPNSGKPLLRQYNPNAYSCNHNYTLDRHENDVLIGLGWRSEGVSWYGI